MGGGGEGSFLIVGVDPVASLILAHYLEGLGHDIEFAEDVDSMLAAIRGRLPLLVFDQLGGVTVAQALRRDFVGLSVVRLFEERSSPGRRPLRAPVVLELPWPSPPEPIQDAVKRLLKRRTSRGATKEERPEAFEKAEGRIGRYLVKELIGRGAMGQVYRCVDETFRREVAIKTIRYVQQGTGDGSQDVNMERFRVEAAALARLVHPHIVATYDFGVDRRRGEMFLVMRYVPGLSLRERLDEGTLDVGEVVRIGWAVADALTLAHDLGVIHRDLKPGNVLLDERGGVFLTDFGLARIGKFSVTNFQTVVGTINYLAPEQVLRPSEVDERTDQYGLAATMHEALTKSSVAPDEISPAAVLDSLQARRPSLASLGVEAPESLERLLRRMLEPELNDRIPDDRTMLEAFRAVGRDLGLELERAV